MHCSVLITISVMTICPHRKLLQYYCVAYAVALHLCDLFCSLILIAVL